jgi:hypothetical protein
MLYGGLKWRKPVEAIAKMIGEIQGASTARQAEIYAVLESRCQDADKKEVRSQIEKQARAQVLTIQWELEEVLDRTAPKVSASPKEMPEEVSEATEEGLEPDPNAPLSSADVEVVYEDPRGLVLHRTKDGKRWLATQLDPQTGQPQTFELQGQQIDQLKMDLAQSPYWVLGKRPL